jgi:hypothetical protein
MKNLAKLMVKVGLLRMPVVRQVTLKDSDLVRLDGIGNFYLVRDGHFYRVTEKFSDIVKKSEPVCLKYVAESRKIDKKYINSFKSFEKFKEDYDYIKKGMEEVK